MYEAQANPYRVYENSITFLAMVASIAFEQNREYEIPSCRVRDDVLEHNHYD